MDSTLKDRVAKGQPAKRKMLTVRGEQRRRKFLDVAGQLFLEQGFAGVSLNEVVHQAGGSLSTLYKCFSSKEALFLAVFQDNISKIKEAVWEIQPTEPTLDAEISQILQRIHREIPNQTKRHRTMQVFLFEGYRIPAVRERLLPIAESELNDAIAGLFTRLSERYDIRFVLSPEEMAILLIRLMRGTVLEIILDPDNELERRESLIRQIRALLSFLWQRNTANLTEKQLFFDKTFEEVQEAQ